MAGWRSVALAAVGTAVSVVAGPAIGLEPWAGALISDHRRAVLVPGGDDAARDGDDMDRWVVLATYGNLHEAYVDPLGARSVRHSVPDARRTYGRRAIASSCSRCSGVRVMVPSSELERARDLLRSGDARRAL